MSFSQEKRNYLHNKLDEVLRLWFRNAGQGYFNLVVNNGVPEFQFGVYSDMGDGLQPDQEHSSSPQHVRVQASQTPSADARHHHGRRAPRRGPARQARNRRRAAAHQAALTKKVNAEAVVTAAATDTSDTVATTALFPGQGQILGTCHSSPPSPPTVSSLPSVSSSLASNITTTSSTNTTSSVPLPGKPAAVTPTVICNDELVREESGEDDELFTFCGRCLKAFDADSDFGCCSRCVKAYHRSCAAGHTCMSYL